MRFLIAILLLAVLLGFGLSSVYTVDRPEYVYVTQFGKHVVTHDGATEGGLYGKLPWPIQSVQRVDSRLQYFDLPETELLTHDSRGQTIDKTITVVAYVCWRIADTRDEGWKSVDWFIRRVGRPEQARTILGEQIRSQLGAAIGHMQMDSLFNTEPGRVEQNMKALRAQLLDGQEFDQKGRAMSLRERARAVYGIEIVDIRLRRTNHPQAVREAMFTRIRSEREKKAADYKSEGKKLADDIKSKAERKKIEIDAEALARERELKGKGEAEADLIRNRAHGKDVEFYAFLKKLEEYQRILGDNRTVLLLSSHRELFDVLFQPPKPGGDKEKMRSAENGVKK